MFAEAMRLFNEGRDPAGLPHRPGWWRIKVNEGHPIRSVPGVDPGWGEPVYVGRDNAGRLVIADPENPHDGKHVADAPVVWGSPCDVPQPKPPVKGDPSDD